jgi:hypothetical protein
MESEQTHAGAGVAGGVTVVKPGRTRHPVAFRGRSPRWPGSECAGPGHVVDSFLLHEPADEIEVRFAELRAIVPLRIGAAEADLGGGYAVVAEDQPQNLRYGFKPLYVGEAISSHDLFHANRSFAKDPTHHKPLPRSDIRFAIRASLIRQAALRK